MNVILIISNPAHGLRLPLSGIGMPVLSTSTVLSVKATGLSPDAIMALRKASDIMKKRIEVKIMPVIVASV